jgi:hypothetical protein
MIDAKKKSALLLCAMVAVALSGCGDTGGGGTGCTDDASCGLGKMCHPTLKSCVASCTSGSECNSATTGMAKCDVGLGSTVKFCQCEPDTNFCNTATTGNVCNKSTLTCTAKCTSDSACSGGGKCNATTGVCGAPTGGGGGDGGMMGMACTDVGVCGAGQVCNFTTDKCQGAGSCNAANAQPDVCGTAGVCNAGTCGQVAKPTCANFKAGNPALSYNPKTSSGPVITSIKSIAADNAVVGGTKFCGTDKGADVTVEIEAYYPGNGTFAATGATVPNDFIKWVNEAGMDQDAAKVNTSGVFRKMSGWKVSNNNKNVTVTASFCGVSGTSIVLGFYFTGGNGFCYTAQK